MKLKSNIKSQNEQNLFHIEKRPPLPHPNLHFRVSKISEDIYYVRNWELAHIYKSKASKDQPDADILRGDIFRWP